MSWVPLADGGADLAQQIVVRGEERVRLTTKERDLLAYLAKNAGRTVTRRELLTHVWGSSPRASEDPVYAVVKRLRAKIDRGGHRHILAVHGDGYRFEPVGIAERASGSRFFGRDAELTTIAEAFDGGAHLVTLVGPGGAGKTRCAREASATRAHVFCDISVATTEASFVTAVAGALDVPLDGVDTDDFVRGIGRVLHAQPERWVILDNAEQAVEIVARMVGRWMPLSPRFLVTSREPLRVAGEQVIALGPLSETEAVALFADRLVAAGGAAREPSLHASIVERLDRLPLAIELAAAQAPHLGVRGLLESLDSQLATLVAGTRDASPRHASLRAAIEWSWTFLDAREKAVLSQLSVFAQAFSIESARAVVSEPDVVAVIASLCRRSLLRREGDRFALYAAVRERARENDLIEAERRHADHFLRAGEAAISELETEEHARAASFLATELSDVRAAWKWALDHDVERAGRLALILDRALGLRAERGAVRRELLARTRAKISTPELRCALLLAEGRIEGSRLALLDEALGLDARLEAEIRLVRGERLAATDLEAARDELDRALALADTQALRGRAFAALGEVYSAQGSVDQASEYLRSALTVHHACHDRRAIARTSALLAHLDRIDGRGRGALDLLRQAEVAAQSLGDPVVRARVLMDLGQHLTRTGDQAGARAALDEAARIYDRVGFARDRALLHLHLAETRLGMGDFELALEQSLAGLAALTDTNDVLRSTFHEAIGCIHLLRNDLREADRWFERGLDIARERNAIRSECTLLGKRGLLRLVRGSFELARTDFSTAAEKNEARGSLAIAGASFGDRAMASFALGDDVAATRDLARARELLHHPRDDRADGRMLIVCEVVGRAFGAVRAGAPAVEEHEKARKTCARLFERVPPQEWDVVLRFLDWILDRIRLSEIVRD